MSLTTTAMTHRTGRRGSTSGRGAIVAAVATALFALAVAPAHASAWVPVEDVLSRTVNPCTGEETALLLHDVMLLVSGPGGAHMGVKYAGSFTTGDGVTGRFRDQDQGNTVPDPDADTVFTQVVLFNGVNGTGQRIQFSSVLHVVVRDGEPITITVAGGGGRCVGQGNRT